MAEAKAIGLRNGWETSEGKRFQTDLIELLDTFGPLQAEYEVS